MFSFLEEVAKITNLPFDIINKGFRVINLSNRAIYIEGFSALIDVSSEEIGIKLKKGIIKINGKHLLIKNMNKETMTVIGEIGGMEII